MQKSCPDILKKIVETKKEELKFSKVKIKDHQIAIKDIPIALDFYSALNKQHLAVIAEIKKASPSAGIITDNFEPEKIADAYNSGNADAVSILTDKSYFKGDIQYIPLVRNIITKPILRKDFIISEYQIYEARANGADSFLLISAILDSFQLKDFLDLGRELKMEALVESHTEYELENAINAGTKIFGINNRNLHNFKVDLNTSIQLYDLIPENSLSVTESGISTAQDATTLAQKGFNAVLIGESLMRSGIDAAPEKIKQFQQAKYI
jgi:indole-3-glycerol phosphate synthase